MKSDKFLTILFFVGSVILIGVSVFFYMEADRTGPAIACGAEAPAYTDGISEAALLYGVTAVDDREGDVTDRLVVEKVSVNEAARTAVVYYAASDMSGNVTKVARALAIGDGAASDEAGQTESEK